MKSEDPVEVARLMEKLGASEELARQLLDYEEFGSDTVDVDENAAERRISDLQGEITESTAAEARALIPEKRTPVQLLRDRGFNDDEVIDALVAAGASRMAAGQMLALEDGRDPSDVKVLNLSEQEIQGQAFGDRTWAFGGTPLEDAPEELAANQDDLEDERIEFEENDPPLSA